MSRIHLLVRDNGAGLSRDLAILARALGEGDVDLTVTAIGHRRIGNTLRHLRVRAKLALERWREGPAHGRFDANLMCERIWPEFLPLARRNALIPNPEWFKPEFRAHLDAIDCVFAKTRHAVPIFAALGRPVRHVGFTSFDRLRGEISRERCFLHLAGRSGNKGTQPLIELWQRHPEWPTLTVVQRAKVRALAAPAANIEMLTRYLDEETLIALQNRCELQLCPSETEGFGHHLVEAMSARAVVLATDAPPMNEMVGNDRGVLVGYASTDGQLLATRYRVDAATLEPGIERMLALDASGRKALGERARAWWEDNDRAFRRRLLDAVAALIAR